MGCRYNMRNLGTSGTFYGDAPPDARVYFDVHGCDTYPILSCQYISDTWGVDFGITWGTAPPRCLCICHCECIISAQC